MKTKPLRPYSVHPATQMVQEWIAALPTKTGKSLEEWSAIAHSSGITDRKERIEWFKSEWKFGTNHAAWIVDVSFGDEDSIAMSSNKGYLQAAARWLENQYSGKKEHLRPVYDHLLTVAMSIGEDVNACPTKTYLSLFRSYAFAQIKPTTNTRIDLGLALGTEPALGRLIDTSGSAKGDRITHRIPLQAVSDVDDEVEHWLKLAYDKDA